MNLARSRCARRGCANICSSASTTWCSTDCSNRSRRWDVHEAELRFHFLRLGSRADVATLYGVGARLIFERLPLRDIDTLRKGEMVNIGGVLAKRCRVCHVTRQLEDFRAAVTRSGCGSECKHCRLTAKSLARPGT